MNLEKMREKWQALREKAADLSLRERGILVGTVSVLIIFVWLQTSFSDYEKQNKVLVSNKAALTQDKVAQSIRLAELTTLLAHDPNAALRQEQRGLNESLQDLRAKIETRMSNLIAPEAMADLMKQVLSDYKGLSLLSAKNLPVEPLNIRTNVNEGGAEASSAMQASSDSSNERQAVIFTHGFEMVLKGNYFQTVEFLQKLENMSGFYWRMLSYQVDKHPNAKITIQLSTLSLEEDWIGV